LTSDGLSSKKAKMNSQMVIETLKADNNQELSEKIKSKMHRAYEGISLRMGGSWLSK
jgi:hypothetical protein